MPVLGRDIEHFSHRNGLYHMLKRCLLYGGKMGSKCKLLTFSTLCKLSFFVISRQSEMLPANNHLFLWVEKKTLIRKSQYAENL